MIKKYRGICILLLGFIGAAGAVSTGYGWFTTGALLVIGATLWVCDRKESHEEESNSTVIIGNDSAV